MQSFLVLLGDGGSNPPLATIDGHTPGMVKESGLVITQPTRFFVRLVGRPDQATYINPIIP